MEEGKKIEDISEEIEKTAPDPVATGEIVEKKEKISKAVVTIPPTSDNDLTQRKKKVIDFLKRKKDWAVYVILSIIVFLGVFIRTINIPRLKDITTGTWTLAPDFDPFLFLRWAKYIVEHGKLFLIDTMRYVPLADICEGISCEAVNATLETKLLPYMLAWFHKFLNFFTLASLHTHT